MQPAHITNSSLMSTLVGVVAAAIYTSYGRSTALSGLRVGKMLCRPGRHRAAGVVIWAVLVAI